MGWIENIADKGENAGYQHFLLFPQCFQKASFSGLLILGLYGKRLTLYQTTTVLGLSKLNKIADDYFNVAQMVHFFFDRLENIVGKGENAGYQHFLLFPQCFQNVFFGGLWTSRILWERVKLSGAWKIRFICKGMWPIMRKGTLLEFKKSINPIQPAQSDHGRNFMLLADFLCIKWKFYLTEQWLWNYWTVLACACFVPVFNFFIYEFQ